VQRLTIRRKGSKAWDEVLVRVSNLTGLLLVQTVAGLDVGLYGLSSLGILYAVLGLIMMAASSILTNWAMIENPHFEATVRIQEDRGHRVVSTGPYRIMRHPGYLSGILWLSSIPLVIGPLYTFIPVSLYSALMILRTLQKELEGYAEYAEKVRYKLFPGVW
jgi:protein-S-isoprenylcysteine O-methyltransferase Ste14